MIKPDSLAAKDQKFDYEKTTNNGTEIIDCSNTKYQNFSGSKINKLDKKIVLIIDAHF